MLNLDSAHLLLRYSHVVVGFLGLGLFWIPVFATKGGRLHLQAGRLFVYCAYFVGATGLISSIWALCFPASFFGDPEMREITKEELPYVVEKVRFLFSILGFLALGILAGAYYGVRVIRTREDHDKLRSPLLLAIEGAFGLWSLGLAIFGAWSLIACYAGWHLLPRGEAGRYWLSLGLGVFGLYGFVSETKYMLRPRSSPTDWLFVHIECMIGTGIGFHTAFLVFGANRLLNLQLDGAWNLVPWLLPSLIGMPAIVIWSRYYQRRFEDLGDQQPSLPL